MERTGLKSPSAVAICSFILVNALFSLMVLLTEGELYDTNLLQNREVFKLIQTQADSCDVLFMGSSVIEVPLSLLDGVFEYVSSPKKAQELLSTGCKQEIRVKNLSIEAALISDQFIAIRNLIRTQKAPRIAVLAVVPRDFSDARLPEPEKTDTFKSLVTLSDLEILPIFFNKFDQYAQFTWTRLIPLYRFRTVITTAIAAKLQLFIDGQHANQNARKEQPLPSNANRTKVGREERFIASLKEYKTAYSLLDKSSAPDAQLQFLRRFCQQCKISDTTCIVLMLPLTKMNRDLLPRGFYEIYSRAVLRSCSEAGVPCIELEHCSNFSDDDFYDGAHLNAEGAKKILKSLIPQICKELAVKH